MRNFRLAPAPHATTACGASALIEPGRVKVKPRFLALLGMTGAKPQTAAACGNWLLPCGLVLLLLLQKRALIQLAERVAQLLLRVHHNRAVPRHRLFERLARDQ